MTTTQALKKLYKKITGENARNSAAKILSDLADNWSGEGGGGTQYEAGDNITINEGVISAVIPSGVAVADAAGDAPTAVEFKDLLDSLRDAGIIASS